MTIKTTILLSKKNSIENVQEEVPKVVYNELEYFNYCFIQVDKKSISSYIKKIECRSSNGTSSKNSIL